MGTHFAYAFGEEDIIFPLEKEIPISSYYKHPIGVYIQPSSCTSVWDTHMLTSQCLGLTPIPFPLPVFTDGANG